MTIKTHQGPSLGVIEGFKTDTFDDGDWLWNKLAVGDVFLCKAKTNLTELNLWGVAFKTEEGYNRSVRLESPEIQGLYKFVDSRQFSRNNIFHTHLRGVTKHGPGDTVEGRGLDDSTAD